MFQIRRNIINKKAITILLTLAGLGIAVWVCFALIFTKVKSSFSRYESVQPFSDGLPETEIVFSPYDPFFSHGVTDQTIGFVDANGNNREVVFFYIAGGSAISWPRHFSTYVNGPRWNQNGDELVFTISDVRPNIRMIDSEGYLLGSDCSDIDLAGYHLDFDESGSIVAWISELNTGYKQIAGNISNEEQLIVKYDVLSCQIVEKLLIPVNSNNLLYDINLRFNLLTAMLLDSTKPQDDLSQEPYRVIIYNTETGDLQMFPGFHPSQSDDGTLLAYFDYNGDLVIRNIVTGTKMSAGTNLNEETNFEFVGRPGWSSDNQWIVFNTPNGDIYKINLNTKKLVFLTKGYTPDWR